MPMTTDSVLMGAWCNVSQARRVLDVGTGTGIIALMVAQRNHDCIIDAIDIDDAAVNEAQANFVASPWGERLTAKTLDFNQAVGQYDLIVSNPPFFTSGLKSPIHSRAMARHTNALTFEQLISHSRELLSAGGRLSFITPFDLRKSVIEISAFNSMNISKMCIVAPSEGRTPVRILWELTAHLEPLVKETLVLRGADGKYTDDYCRLCRDFYLNFP